MHSPLIGLVLWLWQCDKENHGWREGPPLTDPSKVAIREGPSPSRYINSNERKNYSLLPPFATPSIPGLAGIKPFFVH
jgi:hypothetical protein